jgi:hypothetical protein
MTPDQLLFIAVGILFLVYLVIFSSLGFLKNSWKKDSEKTFKLYEDPVSNLGPDKGVRLFK